MTGKFNYILLILCLVALMGTENNVMAACADLDGDGVAETCINAGGGVPAPSAPKPVYQSNGSGSSTSSSSSSSSKSSSSKSSWNSWNSWNATSAMVDSIFEQARQKAAQEKLLQEQKLLEEQKQKLEAEKKKLDNEKKKIKEAKIQQELNVKREANNKWLDNMDKKEKQSSENEDPLNGKIKLLRDPSLYDKTSLTNPKSDIRMSDIEQMKLKEARNPQKNNNQPAYYGPDPKNLNTQGLNYQIKLLDSQLKQCDTGAMKCSPQFVNMLVREKEKYVCELMARGPANNTGNSVSDSVETKLKKFDSTTNTQNLTMQNKNSSINTHQNKTNKKK